MKIDAIVQAVTREPWAIMPEKLEAICELLRVRANDGAFTADEVHERIGAGRPGNGGGGVDVLRQGKIAIISIDGVISQRMGMFTQISGGTSTERIGQQVQAALQDDSVEAIVFDVNSPGGRVEGVQTLAAQIFAARQQKPTYAVANSLMASAAYWIASAAGTVIADPGALVGSIGVFMVHMSYARAAANDGFDFTVVKAGKFKAEGLPHEPLGAEAKAYLQQLIDDTYGDFTDAVALHRGVRGDQVRTGYGEGRALNAKRALEAGLIDRVGTLDQLLADLTTNGASSSSGRGSRRRADDVTPDLTLLGASDAAHAEPAQSAREGADPVSLPLALPAPEAKEIPVSNPTAAPTQGAPADATAALAELQRRDELQALGEIAGVQAAQVQTWIRSGATVATVREELAASRRAAATPSPRSAVTGVHDRELDKRFSSLGEQLVAIVQAGRPGGRVDPRLRQINDAAFQIERSAAISGMNESIGSEGGFFIAPEVLTEVIKPVYEDDPVLSRIRRYPTSKNNLIYNVVDETSRASGSRWGGIQLYWGGEGDTATASKPKLRQMQHLLKKLIGIAYLTDELDEDAPAAQALLTEAFTAELRFVLADMVFRGTGSGQPMGFKNAGCTVTQAIEATQTIANSPSFLSLNLTKMFSRVPSSLWGDVIWLYNQELLPYLLNAVTGTNGVVPIFVPAGGFANRPFDTILGRPAFGCELCDAVGTPGDIVCLAPSQFHMAEKGGVSQATSLHVRFLNDENTLRITYRCDGAPVWKQAITPYKGANTRSPFVMLNTRA